MNVRDLRLKRVWIDPSLIIPEDTHLTSILVEEKKKLYVKLPDTKKQNTGNIFKIVLQTVLGSSGKLSNIRKQLQKEGKLTRSDSSRSPR
jgi:uncharacterized protein YwbE